jgi:hypothetical protein
MKKLYYLLAGYVALYALLYLTAYSPQYIEGDDATTLLYHLCGRNADIQTPYAAYHSGFDYLLSFFPADEVLLRQVSIGLSFVFGFLALAACAAFLREIFPGRKSVSPFLMLFPFILPDMLFHSLILNASNISLAFVMASLTLFVRYLRNPKIALLVASAVCVAIAIPFRWSMLTIFPVFYALVLGLPEFANLGNFKRTIVHSVISLGLTIMAIAITGYSPLAVYEIILWGGNFMDNAEKSMLSMLATGSAFLTPVFGLLLAIGFWSIFLTRRKHWRNHLALIGLSVFPFFLLGFFPALKFFLTLLPMLLIVAYAGFEAVASRRWALGSVVLLTVFMWIVGIRIEATGTLAGPGFAQEFALKNNSDSGTENANPDARVQINKVYPAFGGGFYMPMLEGPRPLYGYAYVLFGGEWKRHLTDFTQERERMLEIIQKPDVKFLQDRRTAFVQCDLFRSGYTTSQPYQSSGGLLYRDFIRGMDTIRINIIPDNVSKAQFATDYLKANPNTVYRSAYSSSILLLTQQCPGLKIIGPYTVFRADKKNLQP